MRSAMRGAAILALLVTVGSCADRPVFEPVPEGVTALPMRPSSAHMPAVRISEVHYDDDGTDEGEAIELSAPAGMELTGWSVVLYNGSNGTAYNTRTLDLAVPASCDPRGVVVLDYPVNGIQNGGPDGIALLDAGGSVVEFLSYEGGMTAVDGPAAGMTSTNIVVSEGSSTPAGWSLQRTGLDTWNAPAPATFGACNDEDDETPTDPTDPPPSGSLPGTRLSEIHYDNDGTDTGEAIEVEGPADTDLTGWSVVLYNGNGGAPYSTRALSGNIPALCDGRGVVVLSYPANGIQNGSPDGIALVDAAGQVVEFLSYEGTMTGVGGPADGMTSTDLGVAQATSTASGLSLQRNAAGVWQPAAPASFGACNSSSAPPEVWTIAVFGRAAGDPPLPVGFEDQLFASLRDPLGNEVETTFTWSSETPAIATIDDFGVVHALSAGTAVLRATAGNGTTRTYSLPTHAATAGGTAAYDGNTEFGQPVDADASDDFVITRDQYTASYSHVRSTPNWVSYNLEATHFGGAGRCDCFTHDPELPAGFAQISTADYTGAGAYHGFGIDRGHLVRSADRTTGSLDNAVTYYFSNIIPQSADMNQGPWANLENTLADIARDGDSEVYIITGVAGSSGTLKGEDRIVIPESLWKVAVIMPRDHGVSDVNHWSDLEIVAVMMPNTAGIRNVSWTDFDTSIDAIEAASGYDLLALLPDDVEFIIESGAHELLTIFNDVAASDALTQGEITSLGATLGAAAASIARGDTTAAKNQIGAFNNQLNTLRKTGRVSDAVAQVLLDAANDVLETLSQ